MPANMLATSGLFCLFLVSGHVLSQLGTHDELLLDPNFGHAVLVRDPVVLTGKIDKRKRVRARMGAQKPL